MAEKELQILVEQCKENNRTAQEQLYRLYCDKMFSVCMYYAKDRDEAADFLQEGFITVFGKLHLYKFEGSFEGWIRRIIVNTALSALRKKKRFMEVNTPIEDFPEAQVDAEEVALIPSGKVIEMVSELPAKAGAVLKLYAIEGYSHQEIAEIMDISIGTSKSQLNRARKLLKKAFNLSNE